MKAKKKSLPPAAAQLRRLVQEAEDMGNELAQLWKRSYSSLPAPEREHLFNPERGYRFDLAWPPAMIAVEGEGGILQKGKGHSSVSGILRDVEKYNSAALLGWTVIRIHRKSIDDGTYLPLFDWVAGQLRGGPTDAEIEAALQAVKFPNGPEDQVIAKYGLTWEQLEQMGRHADFTLSSKLAAALYEVGDICESAVERAAFYKLLSEKRRRR